MRISQAQIQASYDVASRVYQHVISANTGAIDLHNNHGLNVNSAKDFIRNYSHLLRGEVYRRGMSKSAIDFYLTKFFEEHGSLEHGLAISAVEKHINYYERLRNTKLNELRSVVSRHKAKIVSTPDLGALLNNFNVAVKKALTDNQVQRQARLNKAVKLPDKVKVFTYAYVRNPDVVAEVLLRASGKCEHCKKLAPFNRKKDDSPYLEVHHKIQLSSNGEDTVENALGMV